MTVNMQTTQSSYWAKQKDEIANIENQMLEKCEKMSEIRKKYANDLSKKINNQLLDLEMSAYQTYISNPNRPKVKTLN